MLPRIQCVMNILCITIYLDQISKLENKWPWKIWGSRPSKKRRSSGKIEEPTLCKQLIIIVIIIKLLRNLHRINTSILAQWYIRDKLAFITCNKIPSKKHLLSNQQISIGTKSLKTKNIIIISHPIFARMMANPRKATTWASSMISRSNPLWQPKDNFKVTRNLPFWAKLLMVRF